MGRRDTRLLRRRASHQIVRTYQLLSTELYIVLVCSWRGSNGSLWTGYGEDTNPKKSSKNIPISICSDFFDVADRLRSPYSGKSTWVPVHTQLRVPWLFRLWCGSLRCTAVQCQCQCRWASPSRPNPWHSLGWCLWRVQLQCGASVARQPESDKLQTALAVEHACLHSPWGLKSGQLFTNAPYQEVYR